MRDKSAAAKELLERGWTLDEVIRVLDVAPQPPQFVPYPVPYWPAPSTGDPLLPPYVITCGTDNALSLS